jgi:putative Holliday junction resolvase
MREESVKALGIDFGTRRIGLAVSDALGLAAHGLTTVPHRSDEATLRAIKHIIVEHDIEVLVVGLPLNMDGSEGPQAQAARAFGEQLAVFGKPVHFEDERLTTDRAHALLRDAGVRHSKRKRRKDRVAAALILEAWLKGRDKAGC